MRRPSFTLIAIIAHTALAGWLCFVPLFNLLGYEYSLAVGLLAAGTSVVIGLEAARNATSGLRAIIAGGVRSTLILLPGFALITANALRVRNCDYTEGLGFFVLLPVASAWYGATLGAVTGRLLARRSRRLRALVAIAVWLTPLLWSALHALTQPQIFVFDHLWGHFAGSLYDENVGLSSRLWTFRMGTVLRVVGLAVVVTLWERRAVVGWARVGLASAAALGAMATFEIELGPRHGFRVSRADIEAELSDVVERPGLRIHLPPGLGDGLKDAIGTDHEFRLHSVRERLGIASGDTIDSYVYRNADQKARLMGGRSTQVAKPWLNEIHVHDAVAPHPVVGHELVHVVLRPYGSRLLGVSAQHEVLVNMGLVEGVAEALSPEKGELGLHAYTKAMRDLKMSPDIRRILGPAGFWSQAPRRAYTVTGSFVRYLLDEYGPKPFLAAYARGEFDAAYGRPLAELVTEWETFIDALEVLPRDQRQAQERYRGRSIFVRPCAHEIAQLRAEARTVGPRNAVDIHRQIAKHLGETPQARLELARALKRSGDVDGYMKMSRELIEEPGLNAVQRAQVMEERGMVWWERQDLAAAGSAFSQVRDKRISLGSERLNWVRLWALDLPEHPRELMRRFLTGKEQPVAATVALKELSYELPDDRTPPYLVARQLHRVKAWQRALDHLDAASPHPFGPIEAERARLVADCHWRMKDLPETARAYERYTELAPNSGERARARDWIDRVEWMLSREPVD